MPTDANGVYSLPASYLAITGQTIQASQHNPPLEDIAAAVTGRLAVNGANPMTGPVKGADGTVSAPAFTFASAPTSGFYKTAGGWGMSIGGVKVAEFTAGGLASGARLLGELIPYSGATAPALTVFPVGQTLLRAAYPDLWAYAQAEIAAGSTFYNNGNGSTTFGVGDLRGRGFAFKDNMGGVAASRLSAFSISPNANTIGAAGGAEAIALTTAQLAAHTHANTLTDLGHTHTTTSALDSVSGPAGALFQRYGVAPDASGTMTTSTSNITINNASVGSGASHGNVQPTMIVNCLLFAGA